MATEGRVRGYCLGRGDADLIAEGRLTGMPTVYASAALARVDRDVVNERTPGALGW